MSPASWLQPIHLLGSLVWLASTIILGAIALYIRMGGRTSALPRFSRALLNVGRGVIAPAAILVLSSGIWLVLDSSEWAFSQLWVVIGLVLFAVAVLGAIQLTRLAMIMRQGAGSSGVARAQRLWLIGQAGLIAILVAALMDMGLKPGS